MAYLDHSKSEDDEPGPGERRGTRPDIDAAKSRPHRKANGVQSKQTSDKQGSGKQRFGKQGSGKQDSGKQGSAKQSLTRQGADGAVQKRAAHTRPPLRGIYSAIDLGTNNCRLLIAKPTRKGFRVVDAFSRVVRLGEGMTRNGCISDVAMDRAIAALRICADKIRKRGVTCMRHVATEACRVAENADDFLARVKAETGLNIEIISAAEEARLAVMGCQSLVAPSNRHAMVFDIGGGSTELIWVRMRPGKAAAIEGWMSIPWGVVNLTEAYGCQGGHVPPEAYERMVDKVREHLQEFEQAYRVSEHAGSRRVQFLGTSGTVTTLASLHLELPRYMRDKVDGAWMKAADIRALSGRVALMAYDERAAQPCIGAERADLVVAGCAILDAILGMWHVPSLRVADRGIREGILRGLMQVDPLPIQAYKPSHL